MIDFNKIYQGDCLEVLKTFPDEIVDCVVTSPPYWALRDYGTATWEGGDPKCSHKNAKEKSRYDYSLSSSPIQKGDRTGTDAPRWKNVCPDCGAKKKDLQIGLEDSFDAYVSKLCDIFDEVKRILKPSGSCWVNLGDSYSNAGGQDSMGGRLSKDGKTKGMKKPVNKSSLPSKCLCQIPSRFAIEMVDRGWILRNEIIWYKRNCMPSSVDDRFTVDFEKIYFFTKNKQYYFEQQFEPSVDPESYEGRRQRNAGQMSQHDKEHYAMAGSIQDDGSLSCGKKYPNRNKRSVWDITTQPFSDAHFATFPEELPMTCINAGCPNGGVVLDIFTGAGTTCMVAKKLDRKYLGVELNPKYIEIAEERIRKECGWSADEVKEHKEIQNDGGTKQTQLTL